VISRRSLRRFAAVVLCGAIVPAGLRARVGAQTAGKPERYNATAVNMGSGPGMAGRVLLAVDRWTTAKERENLLRVFQEKGHDKLLDALQDSPKVGYIRLPTTLAWDLHYAYETPLPEGGRRVVLATDRPISMREAVNNPRTTDYPYTLIEIRFDKNGVGVGKMSVATKISLSKDKQTIELENYGIEPVRLTEVRIEK
jgi:hypothetical protein